MSKGVQIGNLRVFILFEGNVRLTSVAGLLNLSAFSYQAVDYVSDLRIAFVL